MFIPRIGEDESESMTPYHLFIIDTSMLQNYYTFYFLPYIIVLYEILYTSYKRNIQRIWMCYRAVI